MAAETNTIMSEDLAYAREVEFAFKFNGGIRKLLEVIGTTRIIPKVAGTVLKAYKATGTLQDGNVAEGELIPLSKYVTEPVTFAEIVLKKWRKQTTAEAIIEKGRDQAVLQTNDAMLKDVQKGIRADFFSFLATGTGVATGANFQATIAQAWGQLQVLFEDDDIDAVYFMNPLDVADYLATANISLQTAFGMTYVKDFLGLGTVIFNSGVPKGKIYATAAENVVLYYIPTNSGDMGETFDFVTDETGFIGINETPDHDYMTVKNTVASGVVLFAERLDGVVVGTIGEEVVDDENGGGAEDDVPGEGGDDENGESTGA